ncbi:hypothetical protein BJ944DRAFT_265397 [Cunninghamella echinulata]|nr:hypothetical protein BJ944DRAFT_265397 [Cunninghamella echinulata]
MVVLIVSYIGVIFIKLSYIIQDFYNSKTYICIYNMGIILVFLISNKLLLKKVRIIYMIMKITHFRKRHCLILYLYIIYVACQIDFYCLVNIYIYTITF